MTFVKVVAVCLTIVAISEGQFLTPDQLREQHDLGYGARTHYEMSGGRRTDLFNRVNPDYLLRGFFPFWSVVLIAMALIFLTIAVIGLVGYMLGCRRPTQDELEQFGPDDQLLLGPDGMTIDPDDSKTSPNGYYNNYNQRNFPYESSPQTGRTRIGQSDEDMV